MNAFSVNVLIEIMLEPGESGSGPEVSGGSPAESTSVINNEDNRSKSERSPEREREKSRSKRKRNCRT